MTIDRRHYHAQSTTEERFEDCDICGERYHGEFIDAYLRDEEKNGEVIRVCCRRGAKP